MGLKEELRELLNLMDDSSVIEELVNKNKLYKLLNFASEDTLIELSDSPTVKNYLKKSGKGESLYEKLIEKGKYIRAADLARVLNLGEDKVKSAALKAYEKAKEEGRVFLANHIAQEYELLIP